MSFFKSLLLAIIATVLLTYFLGASFLEFFGIDVATDVNIKGEIIESVKAISVSALITIFLIIAGLAVILSVFGSVLFLILLVFGSIFMFMVGAFWPVLLMGLIIWCIAQCGEKESYS